MSDLIKGVQVGEEVKKLDYEAIGNPPDLVTVDTTLTKSGTAADAKIVGDKFKTIDGKLNTHTENIADINKSLSETNTKVAELNDASANALKGTASGEVVRVDDVSPVGHDIGVKVESKNLITPTYNSLTKNGVTFTVNHDGSISVNGTATAQTIYNINGNLLTKDYSNCVLSGSPKGDNGQNYILFVSYYSSNGEWKNENYDLGDSVKIQAASDDFYRFTIAILVKSGVTMNNVTFYPQLERSDTATEYSPYVEPSTTILTYNEQTYTPNSDGSVEGLISTSPTMEMSVPEGFNISLKYNQDTNAVIKKLTDAVIALGGTI